VRQVDFVKIDRIYMLRNVTGGLRNLAVKLRNLARGLRNLARGLRNDTCGLRNGISVSATVHSWSAASLSGSAI